MATSRESPFVVLHISVPRGASSSRASSETNVLPADIAHCENSTGFGSPASLILGDVRPAGSFSETAGRNLGSQPGREHDIRHGEEDGHRVDGSRGDRGVAGADGPGHRSEEHTSELQSH